MDRMKADKGVWRRRAKRHQREKVHSVVRKEYRMLTDEERRRFHSAMNNAKTDMIDDVSKYDLLTVSHTPEQSPGAHFGPALLPFHRELLKQLEVILRAYDDTVAVPYWDTTLDEPLPNPADSVLWTEHFFGNGAGEVTSGPFKDWRSINDSQIEHLSPTRRIVRSVGTHPNGGLFRRDDVERLNELEDFPALTYCVDPFFELLHGTVHMWVGGHMDEMRVSPNDPAFFLFHSHVDYLWEQWRRLKQTAKQREQHYPTDEQSCDSHHFKESLMKPFAIKNGEGLSNRYTDVFYSYEAAPTCSKEKAVCGSEWLFCDTNARNSRCVSKIVVGGNCTGFESQDACYGGQCVNGRCSALLDDQQITSDLVAEEFSNDTDAVVVFTSNDMTMAVELNETEFEWNGTETNATARDAEEGRSTTFASNTTSATNISTTKPITITPPTTASTSTASVATTTTTTATIESTQTVSTSTPTTRAETVVSRATSVKASAEIALSKEEVPSTTTLWKSERKLATRRPWPFFSVDIRTHKDSMGSVWLPITVLGMKNTTHDDQLSATIRSKDHATNQTFDGAFGSSNNPQFYDGSAFVQVMSPFYSPTGHSVSDIIVVDEEAQPCVSMCLVSRRVQPWKYVKCKAVLTLDVNPHNSDNVAFTPFKDQARLLNWRGSTKLPDQFVFIYCINQHKCCSLWALVGECKQSPWMQFACQRSCFGCDDAQVQQRND
uniref:ShKT domain-containing protein n=1 Tax=Plectus sambesii TaxID=2011161 RepID=A0A914WL47_9BILA